MNRHWLSYVKTKHHNLDSKGQFPVSRLNRLWLSTLLLGCLAAFFQFSNSHNLHRSLRLPVVFVNGIKKPRVGEGWDEWDEWDGVTGSDSMKIHPPCKPTKVEQRGWTNLTEVHQVFNETYQPNVDMVVSLCKESVERIVWFANHLRVKGLYIYSKCGQDVELEESFVKQFENIDVTVLPNVGREGHTFLTHVLRDDLNPDRWTIFLQGQIESTLKMAMLSLTAAHEHDLQNDGTTIINMFRVSPKPGIFFQNPDIRKGEFCTPLYLPKLFYSMTQKLPRYQSHHGSHKYLDTMVNQVTYRGEFVAKNTLFAKLEQKKIIDIYKRLSMRNAPGEGYWLEPLWTSVLGGADNCRCEGMPKNKLPPMQKNMALGKPTQQSRTVGSFAARNAVDGERRDSFASARPKEGNDVSWWEVDLQTISIIRKVTIYRPLHNRKVPLLNATVDILDVDEKVVASKEIDPNGLVLSYDFDYVEGRFVRISKRGWKKNKPKTLNIAQVEVAGYATIKNAPNSPETGWTSQWGLQGEQGNLLEEGNFLVQNPHDEQLKVLNEESPNGQENPVEQGNLFSEDSLNEQEDTDKDLHDEEGKSKEEIDVLDE